MIPRWPKYLAASYNFSPPISLIADMLDRRLSARRRPEQVQQTCVEKLLDHLVGAGGQRRFPGVW
jgi:hypothetical protein